MPEEIKKQVQLFTKLITLFIVIFVVMTVIIASILIMGNIRDSKIESLENKTGSLDNVIRDTLEKYQPDRAAQQLSRETIQDINQTVTQIQTILSK
jgi:outer membrane murein-binding lipoprotein Lpp